MKSKMDLGLKPTFQLAGASVGMGLIGEGLGSEGLKAAGTTTGKFIPMAANIGAAGYMIKQLKGLNKGLKRWNVI